jgi:hypothetical protein
LKFFPNDSFQNLLQQGQNYRFPLEPNWFHLDSNKGEERIFIIASAQPRPDFENLYKKYESAEESKKQEILSHLLKEFQNIRKEAVEEAFQWIFVFKNH